METIPKLNEDQLKALTAKFQSKWSTETYHEIFLNHDSWPVSKLATGGLLQTIDDLFAGHIDNAFAIVRPPGHHANSCLSKGFCVVNNVAIGAKYVLEKGLAKKILIVDWDVHHGNGTQELFYNDDRVLYISTHRHEEDFSHYPGLPISGYTYCGEGKGLGYNVNIPFQANLPLILDPNFVPLRRPEIGDNEMLYVFHNIILPIAHEYQPDLVLVSSGFDASDGDLVGYNWESNAKCGEAVARALLSTETPPVPDLKETDIYSGLLPTVKEIIKTQSKYWKSLGN
uniref:histone deacetylase n=1 Tax=Acrobeloides nanus TaxID=290746 RepID=A0A914C6D2_9BILA